MGDAQNGSDSGYFPEYRYGSGQYHACGATNLN